MSGVSRWRETGHLERAVDTAGGQEAFDASVELPGAVVAQQPFGGRASGTNDKA
jgi:hypothetical protein